MKHKGARRISKHKTYRIVVVIFLIICVCMSGLCFQYYRELQRTVKNESSGYLQEISKQIGSNASRIIDDNFSVLGTISNVLKNAGEMTFEQTQPVVLNQQENWNYQNILLVDSHGDAYDAYGKTVLLSGGEYLSEAVVGRKRTMATSQLVNGKDCTVFIIPVEGLTISGIQMSALAATYDLVTLDRVLSMTAFDGKGYSHIVEKDGSIVVRSSSSYAAQSGYNILNSLSDAEIDGGYSLEQLRADIASGNAGVISLRMNGKQEYMAYTPLDTKEWCLLTFVSADVVNQKSQLFIKLTLVFCGAITFAFALLFCYLMISTYRHKRKLEQIAYIDPVTGGNTIQRFYELAQKLLETPGRSQYALVYINIEKFKILNEQFGRRACDDMLCGLQQGISENLKQQECMGRLFADNFCVFVQYTAETELVKRFESWYESAAKIQKELGSMWLAPLVSFGVYVISNDSMEFSSMVDRAKLALKESTHEPHGKIRYAVYDDDVRKQLYREKYLEDRMETALRNGEFQIYLQPKYRLQPEKIGGAEALVRWINPEEGMIYPDEFISLFEKNGFIIQLDMWVFEEVCYTVRRWIDEGIHPVKVSVNCSRVHLKDLHFLERYQEICMRIGVPAQLIEIELTENMVFEDVEHLSGMINEIHRAGFGCSMDDFGSGYSSLNLIRDIPVDTIKLDKIFFRNRQKDLERTESVVGSIVSMAKALHMETVAEGVEEKPQVEMLRRLGCDYIQGYYFAKPMPVDQFEKLVYGK